MEPATQPAMQPDTQPAMQFAMQQAVVPAGRSGMQQDKQQAVQWFTPPQTPPQAMATPLLQTGVTPSVVSFRDTLTVLRRLVDCPALSDRHSLFEVLFLRLHCFFRQRTHENSISLARSWRSPIGRHRICWSWFVLQTTKIDEKCYLVVYILMNSFHRPLKY